jgi:hypothetical protein
MSIPRRVRISYDRMASYLASYGNSVLSHWRESLTAKVDRIMAEAAK